MKWGFPHLLPWLWLLLPVGWAVFALLRRREARFRLLLDEAVVPVMAPRHSAKRVRRQALLWLLAMGLSAVALARPQWGFQWQEVTRRGLDVMVVLDTSRSMLAQDIKPNRLQQAKWGIRDLVKLLRGDRVGLVAFAGSSFLQCPLTSDYAAFLLTLDDVYAGIIPRGGTAVGQALRTAIESFETKTDADRAIILVTDGEDHAGNIDDILDELKERDIRVFAVGVGSLDGELIPHKGEDGHAGYFKDGEGHVVKTSLNESALERLALDTGGIYVRSASGDFGLERIVERGLSQLQREELDSRMIKAYEERYAWVLGLALLLFGIEACLLPTRGSPPERLES